MTLPTRTPAPPSATVMEQVRERVDADESLAVEAGLLVIAALEGNAALTQALAADGSAAEAVATAADPDTVSASSAATGVFVNSIGVQGLGVIYVSAHWGRAQRT